MIKLVWKGRHYLFLYTIQICFVIFKIHWFTHLFSYFIVASFKRPVDFKKTGIRCNNVRTAQIHIILGYWSTLAQGFQNICITISWVMMASSRCAALLMGVFLCFCYVFFWQKLNISPYYYYWRPEKWVMVHVFFSWGGGNITRERPNELWVHERNKIYSISVPGWESLKRRHSGGIFKQPPPVTLQMAQPSNGSAPNRIYSITQRMALHSP